MCDHHGAGPLGQFASELLSEIEEDRNLLAGLIEKGRRHTRRNARMGRLVGRKGSRLKLQHSVCAPPQPKYRKNHQMPRNKNKNTAAEATNVKRSTKAVAGGICLGTVLYYGWRWYQGLGRIRNFHLTTEDLNYSDRSPEELVSQHLIDLNGASAQQIGELGISAASLERLLENRPYRNKLELVSRMVLSQDEYSAIKDKVSVAEASEPVKIA